MVSSFKKFLVLWSGQLVAAIGHGITAFALGVYAFSFNQSSFDSSMVLLLGFLPSVVLMVPAGVLADRYDRRLLMIIADGLSAIGVLYILIMKMQGSLQLIHIYIGVAISSLFSSLMQPAFSATVSDLLTRDEYTKASGMVQVANSAKFLIAPVLAGFLMKYGLELILIIDICTVFFTVLTTVYIKKQIATKKIENSEDFMKNLKEGWLLLKGNKGLFNLVLISAALTFFMGVIQTLSNPYFLTFSDSETLGVSMTVSALGMLFGGILLGIYAIKSGYVKKLALALFLAGLAMIGFGATINVVVITIFGFVFFSFLPITNTILDYLVRSNTKNEHQGRIWAFIGFISQMGFVISYPLSGFLADKFFTPAFYEGGLFYGNIGKFFGTGPSKGIGFEIVVSGILLSVTAIFLYRNKHIHELEISNLGDAYEQKVSY